jgi:hypothetical protein
MAYKKYNKEELFSKIDKISIERQGNTVTTKYDDRVIKVANVSSRYEIFDIAKYLKEKINQIEDNFTIHKYNLVIKGGQQKLELLSDKVKIGEVDFHKSFFILNSSDKSRRLSFSVGLKSNGFYVVGNNLSLNKKHLRGVTQAAEEASVGLSGETFEQQIDSIKSLLGHRIKFSNVRNVILNNEEFSDVTKVSHRKFDAFKSVVRWSTSGGFTLDNNQKTFLYTPSNRMNEVPSDKDFFIDAFWAFKVYLGIFNRQDSHVVKKESERIMKLTQWAVRNSVLESLGV